MTKTRKAAKRRNKKPMTVKAGTVALAAAGLVSGERERTHGTKRENFEKIADMWNAYFGVRRDKSKGLNAEDVGHMMGLLKIARTQHGAFNLDDYQDAVGYAACTAEVATQIHAEAIG